MCPWSDAMTARATPTSASLRTACDEVVDDGVHHRPRQVAAAFAEQVDVLRAHDDEVGLRRSSSRGSSG